MRERGEHVYGNVRQSRQVAGTRSRRVKKTGVVQWRWHAVNVEFERLRPPRRCGRNKPKTEICASCLPRLARSAGTEPQTANKR